MDRLDELAVFVAIIDCGSLAEAGRRLRRSPAAVTRALGALEDRLGTSLIERTTRRLAPTEAGRRLVEDARRLLADYGETMRAANLDASLKGHLRVTAPVVFGRRHVMPLVATFLQTHPDITVEMICSDSRLDLIEEELDIAVRIGPLEDSRLVARRVGQVVPLLVASPAYVQARGMPTNIDDLSRHDVVFIRNRPVPIVWRLHEDGRERVLRPSPRLTVNQMEAGLDAARAGVGIARAVSYQLAEDLAAGRLLRILPGSEPPPIPIHLVTTPSRYTPARLRALLDHLTAGIKATSAAQWAPAASPRQPEAIAG